ncbi:MAG: hypothetical protein H0W84_02805 [Bacteroidetes bacterium]|nr:hypothetical protein [Bacteroidota bacterium]
MKTQTNKKPKTARNKRSSNKVGVKGKAKRNDLSGKLPVDKSERDTSAKGGGELEDKDHPHEYKTPKAEPEEIDNKHITNKPNQITNQKDQITNLPNE